MAGFGYAYKRKYISVYLLLFVISGPFFILLANLPIEHNTSLPILEPNLLMPGLIWALCIGLGLNWIADLRISHTKWISGSIAVLLIVSGVSGSRGRGMNNRDNFLSYDFGKNILRSMEPGSILYNSDDPTTFITEYLKTVHEYRNDIRTFVYFRTLWGYHRLQKLYPEIMPDGSQDNAHEMLDAFFKKNIGSLSLYGDLPFKFPEIYKTIPQGLVYRLSDNTQGNTNLLRAQYLLAICPLRQFAGIYDPDAFFSRQIFSYYTSAHNNLAVALLEQGNADEARTHYWNAVALDPMFKEGWNNLGALEFKQGNLTQAEKYFNAVINLKKSDMEGWYHLGLVLRKKGEIARAVKAFERIPQEGKNGAYALNELGLISLSQKNQDTAVEQFVKAISIMPSYSLPYYNLGLAYQRKGDYVRAISAYERYAALCTDPREKKETIRLIQQLKAKIVVPGAQ
ncbi:MAG: tetratricopeptide repeat protein [bacterium]